MEYTLRTSARARHLRIEVPFGGPPLLVVPQGVSRARAERFLAERRPWVERQLARQVPRLALPPVSEREGRRRARDLATELCARESPLLGVRYERIRIAAQRSRWGSCSSRGTLSFNWRLVLAPPEVFDYVAVHELCHLREPSHSPRFWSFVEAARPDYRRPRRWLREHGAELLAHRPA